MTISQIEPHHQNDRKHYEGPDGSKERFKNFILPEDLKVLGGNAAEEYPDYLGQCASLDENLGRLVERLKKEGLYEDTVIIFASDHGSHFLTRNRDDHLNGYDDYKRSCHDGCLHVPLVIAGGPFQGGEAAASDTYADDFLYALSRRLSVSRETVRAALDCLTQEGLLRKVKGSGTYINKERALSWEPGGSGGGSRSASSSRVRTATPIPAS